MLSSLTGPIGAERIKLTSLRSPRWSFLAVTVCCLGLAALQGAVADGAPLTPDDAVVGAAVLGVPLLMVLAAVTVTNEYRSAMIRTTFIATPRRATVMVAKAVVVAAFSAFLIAVLSIADLLVAGLAAGPASGAGLSFTDPEVWRTIVAMTAYAASSAVLGIGVGALLRHTAGAVALLLLWPLVIEPVVSVLPRWGPPIAPYLPFHNVLAFVGAQPPGDVPWGRIGCLVYFVAVVAVVFIAGTVSVDRRDA